MKIWQQQTILSLLVCSSVMLLSFTKRILFIQKKSSDRWENVKNVMYEEEKGLLRAYKPYASGRNFRLLMEKVFTKAIKTVALAKMTGTTTLPGILELSVLGGAFFECKRIGEEKSQKRKEILEKQKNDINEAEEDMGLLP